ASAIQDASGNLTTADGHPVQCTGATGYCRLLTSGDRVTASPLLQDLELSGWGLGEGISVHAHVRGRETLGSNALPWPRVNDHFDALDAYVNIERTSYRARLGRQWTSGALGVYNFDGATMAWHPARWTFEGFGGSSLVTGLNDTHLSGAFSEVDDLPPDERAWLFGGRVRYRSTGRTSLTAEYQRQLRTDRGALYAERASIAASTRWMGIAMDGEWTEDLITQTVNEARLHLQRAFPHGHDAVIELRRSRPFFELWSIWGAFSPVGYDEARAAMRKVTGHGSIILNIGGAYRRYDSSGEGLATLPLRRDGWRATGNASFTPNTHVTLYTDYAIDIGPGASRSDGSVGGQWTGDRWSVGLTGSSLQSIYEYRVGTGRVIGASGNASWQISSDTRLAGDVALYSHRLSGTALGTDWSQRRASLRLEWAIGHDPGDTRHAPLLGAGGSRP
ncbi:MAG: hypothetical protein U0132_22495, partial [Gemmatimonadaceae bacterium]